MTEEIPTRNAYGEALVELGAKNEDVVVLDADLAGSTRTTYFAEEYEDRFFQVGIAEQNMMGMAAGLATCGKVAFASTFAVFGSARVADQIRNSIAYPNLNVKIAVTHAGITVGPDGATHQSVEDLSILRAIPNMTVIVPADYTEAKAATKAAAEYDGPVYLRFGRVGTPVVFAEEDYKFEWGKVNVVEEGSDVTIFAAGMMLAKALEAKEELAQEDISAEVVNVHTIKPLDVEGVVASAKKTGAVVTAEEHNIYGGLGSAIAEAVAENYPVPVKRVGVKDTFGKSGAPKELIEEFDLTAEEIVKNVKEVIKKK
ncbi:transketolase, alpha subunit [Halobacteroides halobius DSM 5150]|uniref:Transketolase, alpha subunit n=1 Tax=Halobacteroides halobius (strain ATCC 35273 / DSM 5150 / MD-1) TaxID=748449 RepID=L0K9V4_HALHC|nr:transketolase family protein [Halobacteroides halobius]AGB42097.1 transketolase, alpha subunit [Halobacteroides halobius DSM 5150]